MERKRITGVSTMWAGLQWENVKDQDKHTARAVIAFLEDRRVLFVDRHFEDQEHCLKSVFEIRAFLTQRLTADDIGDDLAETLKVARAACRAFIEAAGPGAQNFYGHRYGMMSDPFSLALGDLRARIGVYVEAIARQYKLPVAAELASIMPPQPSPNDDDLSWLPGFGER
jgi:hypothetical protein